MSDKAKPFTKAERETLLRECEVATWHGQIAVEYRHVRGYEAAVVQGEAERDALRHERDKLKVELSEAQEKRDALQDDVWDLTCELENEEP